MPAPTPLAIATSSLTRLVKEEQSYHSELAHQISNLKKIEPADENAEYQSRQEKRAIDETKTVIEDMHLKIKAGVKRVEEALEESGQDPVEVEKAKEARESGKKALV